MFIDHPFHFDDRRFLAATSEADHVRDMIEQLLLTSPGERVNRPDFGCGLLRQTFEPNSPELAAAVKFTIVGAINRFLGDLVEAQDLNVEATDAVLAVTVRYVIRRNGERKQERFEWSAP